VSFLVKVFLICEADGKTEIVWIEICHKVEFVSFWNDRWDQGKEVGEIFKPKVAASRGRDVQEKTLEERVRFYSLKTGSFFR
jgi:hypothetical protein